MLYTACRHRGFVMISYYDIRAAQNAKRELQNKPLKRRKLDIHYSIPKVWWSLLCCFNCIMLFWRLLKLTSFTAVIIIGFLLLFAYDII